VLPGGVEFTHVVDAEGFDLLFGMRPEGEDLQPLARSWARPPSWCSESGVAIAGLGSFAARVAH
jgi:hypothetical protein